MAGLVAAMSTSLFADQSSGDPKCLPKYGFAYAIWRDGEDLAMRHGLAAGDPSRRPGEPNLVGDLGTCSLHGSLDARFFSNSTCHIATLDLRAVLQSCLAGLGNLMLPPAMGLHVNAAT